MAFNRAAVTAWPPEGTYDLAESQGDVTVNLSMERIIAYALMMLTIGSLYAKIQGDMNYLKERSDKMEARMDRIENRLYQIPLERTMSGVRNGSSSTAQP